MSVPTATLKRLPVIKDGILKGLTRGQIGDMLGVSERTVRRDIRVWIDSGHFDTWLKEEFLRLHVHMLQEDPVTAYREIARLVGKSLTRKVEAHVSEEIRHITLSWKHTSHESDHTDPV